MSSQRTILWATLGGLLVVTSALLIGVGAASGLHAANRGTSAPAASGFAPAVVAPNYTVTFTALSLPAGNNWSVSVCITPECEDDDGSLFASSNNSTITFSLPNGTYFFSVPEVNDTQGTPSQGSFTVAGASPAPIVINFGTPAVYAVTFMEKGLPPGTDWSVSLGENSFQNAQGNQDQTFANTVRMDGGYGGDGGGGGQNESNNTTIQFFLPNGTYNYSIDNVSGFAIVGAANGSFNVSGGSPAPIVVKFGNVTTYPVTFVENGLPNGTNWSVGVHGTSGQGDQGDQFGQADDASDVGSGQTTSNSSMVFQLINGSYRYRVGEVDGYMANVSFGMFNVTGSSLTIYVNFTALPTYNVTFNESGLPNGTDWGLKVMGSTGHLPHGHAQLVRHSAAARGLVTFQLPNGKYHYKLIPLSGWKVSGGFVGKHFKVVGTTVSGAFVFHPKLAPRAAPLAPVSVTSVATHYLSGLVATVRSDLAGLPVL